jgi:hypothetical protein
MRRIIALAFLALTIAGGLTTLVVLSSDQAQAQASTRIWDTGVRVDTLETPANAMVIGSSWPRLSLPPLARASLV